MESDLVALLEAICPRVSPDVAPLSTQRPYITYQQIGGRSLRWLDNTASDKRHALIQINVWHSQRIAATDMAHAIEESLCTQAVFVATPQGEIQTTYEHDLGLYGTIQTFGILYRR